MPVHPIQLLPNGALSGKDQHRFGGEYSLLDKIRLSGTGSVKVIYEAGIPAFDPSDTESAVDTAFVSFDLLRNGLILRLNRAQRLAAVGVLLAGIRSLELIAYRILTVQKKFGRLVTQIVHRGVFTLVDTEGNRYHFTVITQHFPAFLAFLLKEQLIDKLSYSISLNPPERDDGSNTNALGGFLFS